MRVKTDERRQVILDAAWDIFKANGFERATMSEISDRVGGSKATIYSYFKSKEELFEAALEQVIRERTEAVLFEQVESMGDLKTRLLNFARAYMQIRLETDMIAVTRALISEADRSDLGATFQMRFIIPSWRRLGTVLSKEMAAGRLRSSDPYLAALHFRGLIEADIVERRLHGDDSISPKDVKASVSAGVDAFLRAYST